MTKPWGKTSRRTFHRQQVRRAKRGSKARLVAAWNFYTAMVATAQGSHPGSTQRSVDAITESLIEQAEALAERVPAEKLERGGARS